MKGSEMEVSSEIEACRTCGIFFLKSSNLLRYLFNNEPEILLVRKELESWKMQLNENDEFPKYICTICLLEFHRIFKFQTAVIETQRQIQQLFNIQQENMKNMQKMKIKTEKYEQTSVKQEPTEVKSIVEDPNPCGFIYVDDLSDEEDYASNDSRNITPFKVPHVPIKEEIIEAVRIPKAEETQMENIEPKQEIPSGIQCKLCLHVSEDQQQYRQHLLRIHETKPVECHICGKQFPPGTTETRLKYHMKWHRINKHVKCSQCGFHCPSRDVLNEHMRAVHTKTPCKICGKLLLPRKMRLHLQKHGKENESVQKLDCPYCVAYFASMEDRNQHIMFYHATTEQISMSSFEASSEVSSENDAEATGASFEAPSSSSNEHSLFLDDVDDNVDDEASQETDELDENNAENIDSYETEECFNESYDENCDAEIDEFVENENSYETNELEDENLEEMQFACAQCPERFLRIEQLITHAETHAERAKSFECEICGKVFDLKFSLNRHLKKHKKTKL